MVGAGAGVRGRGRGRGRGRVRGTFTTNPDAFSSPASPPARGDN